MALTPATRFFTAFPAPACAPFILPPRVCRPRSSSTPPPASSPELPRKSAAFIPYAAGRQRQGKSLPPLPHCGGRYPGPHPSHGLEHLVHRVRKSQRRKSPPGRRRHDLFRHGRLRLSIRECRRRLAHEARLQEPRIGRRAARRAGNDPPQRPLPGYGCPGRLHPRQRTQGRPLFVSRSAQLRGL